jgi:hypothetical protein
MIRLNKRMATEIANLMLDRVFHSLIDSIEGLEVESGDHIRAELVTKFHADRDFVEVQKRIEARAKEYNDEHQRAAWAGMVPDKMFDCLDKARRGTA